MEVIQVSIDTFKPDEIHYLYSEGVQSKGIKEVPLNIVMEKRRILFEYSHLHYTDEISDLLGYISRLTNSEIAIERVRK